MNVADLVDALGEMKVEDLRGITDALRRKLDEPPTAGATARIGAPPPILVGKNHWIQQ